MTVMTSWDLFDDLRSAQDELLQMNRMYGQRLLPPGGASVAGSHP